MIQKFVCLFVSRNILMYVKSFENFLSKLSDPLISIANLLLNPILPGHFWRCRTWGGGGGIGAPTLYFPKLTKLGTNDDCDKLYFILVVKVLNWL